MQDIAERAKTFFYGLLHIDLLVLADPQKRIYTSSVDQSAGAAEYADRIFADW